MAAYPSWIQCLWKEGHPPQKKSLFTILLRRADKISDQKNWPEESLPITNVLAKNGYKSREILRDRATKKDSQATPDQAGYAHLPFIADARERLKKFLEKKNIKVR